MKSKKNIISKNIFFYFSLLFYYLFLTIITRNVDSLHIVSAGEFRNPFFPEIIFFKSIFLWDDSFSLGFNNFFGENRAEYAIHQPLFVFNNFLDLIFSKLGGIFFSTQYLSLIILSYTTYKVIKFLKFNLSDFEIYILSFFLVIIYYGAAFSIGNIQSGAKYLLVQSLSLLVLISFINIFIELKRNNYYFFFIYLYILGLIFSPFYIVLILFFFLYTFIDIVYKKKKTNLNSFFKIWLLILISLFLSHGLSIYSIIFESNNLSPVLNRHDIPLPISTFQILDLFPNSFFNSLIFSIIAFIGFFKFLFFKNKSVLHLVLFIIFFGLSHGSSGYLSEINIFIHQNIKFMSFFGSTYPYTSIVINYLIIFGIFGFVLIYVFLKNFISTYKLILLFSLLPFLFIVNNPNLISGNYGGKINSYNYPDDYFDFKKRAEKYSLNTRFYYFPDNNFIVPDDYNYSKKNKINCCYSYPFVNTFPIDIKWSNFQISTGSYSKYMNFYMSKIKSIHEIIFFMNSTNTSHLVFDTNVENVSKSRVFENILSMVKNNSAYFQLDEFLSNKSILVFKLKNTEFKKINTNINLLSSNLNNLKNMVSDSQLNQSFVFIKDLDENIFTNLAKSNLINEIYLYETNFHNFYLDLISNDNSIIPFNINKNGSGSHWSTYNNYYQETGVIKKSGDLFLEKKPSFSVFAEKPLSYKVSFDNNDNYIFIRAYVSPTSGKIKVNFNDQSKVINLTSKIFEGFHWFKLNIKRKNNSKINIDIYPEDKNMYSIIDSVFMSSKEKFDKNFDKFMSNINSIKIKSNDKHFSDWLSGHEKNYNLSKIIKISNKNFEYNENFSSFMSSNMENIAVEINELNYKLSSSAIDYISVFAGNYLNLSKDNSPFEFQILSDNEITEISIDIEAEGLDDKNFINLFLSSDVQNNQLIKIDKDRLTIKVPKKYIISKDIKLKFYPEISNFDLNKYLKKIRIYGLTDNYENIVFKDYNSSKSTYVKGNNYIRQYLLAYDKNWDLSGQNLFKINFGHTASICEKDCGNLKNKYSMFYKIFIYINFIFLIIILLVNLIYYFKHASSKK